MHIPIDTSKSVQLSIGQAVAFPYVQVSFAGNIPSGKLHDFRSAVCSTLAKNHYPKLDLYHNHDAEGSPLLRYPRVIYRTHSTGAELVLVNEAVDGLAALPLLSQATPFYFGSNENSLIINGVNPQERKLGYLGKGEFRYYRLHNWLPFNQPNHHKWLEVGDPNSPEAETLLRNILIGNILSLAKGFNAHFSEPIKLRHLSVQEKEPVRYKDTLRHRFDAIFATNLQLPTGLGLGKNVSFGHGRIAPGPRMPLAPKTIDTAE
jgi:hypothetical protein